MKMVKPQQADIQLWNRMQTGDELALAKLIKLHFNFLLNYGCRFVKDRDFVKDCVQEIFIDIWQKKERICVPDSVRAYLLTCVRKRVIRQGERQRIIKEEPTFFENQEHLYDMVWSVENELIENETTSEIGERVKRSIERLPKRQQEVLYLQYFQNLSRSEIAEIMDINIQSVSNLLHSAFNGFRQHWSAVLWLVTSFIIG